MKDWGYTALFSFLMIKNEEDSDKEFEKLSPLHLKKRENHSYFPALVVPLVTCPTLTPYN